MTHHKDLISLTVVVIIIISGNIAIYTLMPFSGMMVVFSVAGMFPVAICIQGWVLHSKRM